MSKREVDRIEMNEKKQDMSYLPVSAIRPAPENSLLYDSFTPNADYDDNKLYFSIKADGIREPLHISADGFILSGHRRCAVAQWLGHETVPCIVEDDIVYNDLPHLPQDYVEFERIRAWILG